MGLSVASLNPITTAAYVAPKQQAYSIDSQSAVSQSYRESIGNTSTPQGVHGPAPVRYSNTRYEVRGVENLVANQRMNRGFNSIAASFNGVSTGYGRDMKADSYATYGQSVDLFA